MIDWGFIGGLEGRRLVGYVPNAANSRSGVTVASGVDIGNMTTTELTQLPLDLRKRLTPYVGKRGLEAVAQLKKFPLQITPTEAALLDQVAETADLDNIASHYLILSGKQFTSLKDAAQTVLASVGFQYGNVWDRCPHFWLAACNQDYPAMVRELHNFGDAYSTRRNKEADYLMSNLHTVATVKLGKAPVRHDSRTLKMAKYTPSFPTFRIPDMTNWGANVKEWGMMCNDELGCCTIAAVGHYLQSANASRGLAAPTITDTMIKEGYSHFGYDGTEATDGGAVELDVLNYWRRTGFWGHKIMAYVAIDPKNWDQLRTAIYLFGLVYAGVQLPNDAQGQTPWDNSQYKGAGAVPGSWGGHAIPLLGYDTHAVFCPTWGANQWMTKPWWMAYGDEAYAVIGPDWASPAGVAPSNFNMDQLLTDMKSFN